MENSYSIAADQKANDYKSSKKAEATFVSVDNNPPGTSGFRSAAAAAVATAGSIDEQSGTEDNDAGVIAAPASSLDPTMMEAGGPAEIPPEPTNGEEDGEGVAPEEAEAPEEDDDESEYEYEDEDDAAFSGFLVEHAPLTVPQSGKAMGKASTEDSSCYKNGSAESPARIRDEDESVLATAASIKTKWREPSRDAVNMSLRAEREKTGSKRRLAQDLYRIMNQDTEEAGFSIAPKSEDNMDHWIIKLFKFDRDSNLAKDMVVLGYEHIELEMSFPDQYPFEPPFVRVVRPRFKRQTGFVMNGALCMELLTKDGWNPVNDIESVIVSIRSLLVVGDGRLHAAHEMSDARYQALLEAAAKRDGGTDDPAKKRLKMDGDVEADLNPPKEDVGSYSMAEAKAAYSHLSDYHKKKGWDTSGWWARKG